jgi:hypothetical protein
VAPMADENHLQRQHDTQTGRQTIPAYKADRDSVSAVASFRP